MKRAFFILLHIVFWGLTGALIVSSFSVEAQEIEVLDGVETVRIFRNKALFWQLIGIVAIATAMVYANLWNLSRLNDKGARRKVITRLVVTLIIAVVTVYLVTVFRWFGFGPVLPYPISYGILAFYLAVSVAYGLARGWYVNQQRQQQLALEKKQAELTLLRNQLQPHFLFNALNNLLFMVDQQRSPKLADGFERLSQLLRYVVEEPPKGKVSIRKELEFLHNYVAMQLLRFEEGEVQFDLQVKGEYSEQLVEPGLFLPFVENAFKYGTEPEQQSTIHATLDITRKGTVTFSITNQTFRQKLGTPSTGSGIAATRRRLELVYPEKHQLTISEGDPFMVELTLQTI